MRAMGRHQFSPELGCSAAARAPARAPARGSRRGGVRSIAWRKEGQRAEPTCCHMSASLEEQGTTENGPPTFGLAVVHCPRAPPSSHPCSRSPSREGSAETWRKRKKINLREHVRMENSCKTSRKSSPCRRSRTKVLTPLTDSFTSFTIITAHTSNLLYAEGEVC